MIYLRLASITNVVLDVWDTNRDPEPILKGERLVPLHEYLKEKDEKLNAAIGHLVELAKLVISIQEKLKAQEQRIILPPGV